MKKLLTTIFSFAMALGLHAAGLNKLPVDTAVHRGTLPNGLTYYLLQNDTPSGNADFFLAQRVGSINEDDDQRGLAHFLEHLCFNGSTHFPGNSLISYLESIGVKFGANLNAYTSTDKTVYNICKVPTARQTTVDSCLLILRDWCRDLTLSDEEIDKERGVIKSEYRHRGASASNRMLEKAAPEIYAGSRYGHRLPIGLMEIVENCPYSAIRNYYDKWYHPENQCVIVVGDIDVNAVEKKIATLFSDIPAHTPTPLPCDIAIPDNKDMIVSVQQDKEQAKPMVQLYIKHHGVADEEANTIAEVRHDYELGLISQMLAERFDELEQQPDAPFTNLGVGDVSFLLASNPKAFVVRAFAKPGRENDCMKAYASILKQASRHGFTETELGRAKLEARADIDSRFANRDHRDNTAIARRLVNHFLDGGELMSEEAYYKMMKGVERTTKLEDVNNRLRSIVNDDNLNLVALAYLPENDDNSGNAVTRESLRDAYLSVDSSSLEAYVDNFGQSSILNEMPKEGKVASMEKMPLFDSEKWTLSNGINVYVRQSAESPDQIIIAAQSPGGFSQKYDASQAANYQVCNDVLAVSGFGGHSSSELRKLLVGKKANVSVSVGNMDETLSVVTTPRDLETAMQMLYLKATAPCRDDKAFETWMANKRMSLESRNNGPVNEMGDSIHANVYSRHPLGCKLHLSDLDNISYDEILAIHKDRFGDMSDFSFFVAGNFDRDSLATFLGKYVASLPTAGRMEKPKDIGYRYTPTAFSSIYERDMETPVAITYNFYHNPVAYNLQNVVNTHAIGQILKTKLMEDLREEKGWTYGVQTHCGISAGMNGADPASLLMPVYIKVEPGHEAETREIVGAKVAALATPGNITDEEVLKVKQGMLKDIVENRKDNSYWTTVMRMYDKFGEDMDSGYEGYAESLTPATLAGFAAANILPATRIQLTMQPTPTK